MKIHFLDDDYSTNRYHEITLSSLATKLGRSISFYDHPVSLLETYQSYEDLPDVLFLDINMPIIDGWKFLELFNKKFENANTKLIILTTSNDPMILEKSKEYNNVHNLALKPLSAEIFEHMFENPL